MENHTGPEPLENSTGQPDWDWNNSRMCLGCYKQFLPSEIKEHEKYCPKLKNEENGKSS